MRAVQFYVFIFLEVSHQSVWKRHPADAGDVPSGSTDPRYYSVPPTSPSSGWDAPGPHAQVGNPEMSFPSCLLGLLTSSTGTE